jgi:hypothetical protein
MTPKLLVIAAALLAMWGLKRHYADARADELTWILYPTTRVVAVVTGAEFRSSRWSRDRGTSRASGGS